MRGRFRTEETAEWSTLVDEVGCDVLVFFVVVECEGKLEGVFYEWIGVCVGSLWGLGHER